MLLNEIDPRDPVHKIIKRQPNPDAVPKFSSAFVREVNREAAEVLGREPDDDPIDQDDIRQWLSTHRGHFRGGRATLYRVMRLEQDVIDGLQPGAELGQHWTLDHESLDVDGLDHGRNEGELYLFTAEVTTRDIAWALTIAYNIEFPHENEAFVDYRGDILLKSIHLYDMGNQMGEPVRPDLNGQRFKP